MKLARQVLLVAVAVALTGALAACGGGSDVPDDYEEASQLGATFSVPPGLQAGEPREVQGSQTISYTGGDEVSLSIRALPGRGDTFGTLPDQQRAVIEGIGSGEVDGQESLEVPGADEGYVLTGKQTGDKGEVDVATVGARKGQDVWMLTVYAKAGGDASAEGIAKTLRVGEG